MRQHYNAVRTDLQESAANSQADLLVLAYRLQTELPRRQCRQEGGVAPQHPQPPFGARGAHQPNRARVHQPFSGHYLQV